MCGIAGYFDKTSAGVAIYNHALDGDMVLRVKMGEEKASPSFAPTDPFAEKGREITQRVQNLGTIGESSATAEYLRLVVDYEGDPAQLEQLIEANDPDIEVVSMGQNLEIIKQVGSPENLEATHAVSDFVGSHGIGHTRMSTESRIDLSHSQPFWAHGYPDLATVHNGHITNYHKLRSASISRNSYLMV